MKEIAVLGSTGSIGTQTLDVIRSHPDLFHAQVLCANKSVEKLLRQAEEFHPAAVVVCDEEAGRKFKSLYTGPAEVIIGQEGLTEASLRDDVDLVLVAVVGIAGLAPTLAAIGAEKELALANKETLVAGGSLVLAEARKHHVLIRPVDSEHSAIFQCLNGEHGNKIDKILLTASGGPFRGWTRKQMERVQVEDALKHPNWSMGRKITIDSSTMVNKGLEVMEARWLFDVDLDRIQVVVQPKSIIHSMVQFEDGAVKAQLGMPDMRLPIQYAFSYPDRLKASFPRLDFKLCTELTFEQPDITRFRNLALAYEALHRAGNMPCIVNAANEVVVAAFLQDKISFLGMSEVIEKTMSRVSYLQKPTYEDYVATDAEARRIAEELI